MDEPGQKPVTVEMNGQAAKLLIKLMGDLQTDEPMAVLTRALGVLEQAVGAKARGQRLGVYDPPSGRFMDLVI
ncbi:MAG TPA: hypothetical protein VH560_10540 [Polyangia bacterium]|jgi:hypothetical protein|nr:hypothetical protein [Polyangia bacterium]